MIHHALTLADARNLLAKFAPEDSFEANLNMALSLINSFTGWRGLRKTIDDLTPYVTDGVLQLPPEYRALVAARSGIFPIPIFTHESEYSQGGPGVLDAGTSVGMLTDLGFDYSTPGEGDQPQLVRSYKVLSSLPYGLAGIVRWNAPLVVDETDLVIPSNLLVLRDALLAIEYENQGDVERANACTERARARLIDEFAEDTIGVSNTFDPGFQAVGLEPLSSHIP